MEVDWEIEIGRDAPIIEAHWNGFVDLRAHPERVSELSECCALPELANALVRLNGPASPVWTTKTDVFTPDPIDPDEMNASLDESLCAIACYVDIVQRDARSWDSLPKAERDCEALCSGLRTSALRCCRTDIIVRKALVGSADSLGATVYFTACGSTVAEAKSRIGHCIMAFTQVIVSIRPESAAGRPRA